MKQLELVITGCILFEGQREEQGVLVVEVNNFHFMHEEDIDDFGEDYLDNGGDSYSIVHEDLDCSDIRALDKLNDLEKEIKRDFKEVKENGVLISSVVDELSLKLDLIEKWRYIFNAPHKN